MAVTILDSPNESQTSAHSTITVTGGQSNRLLYVMVFQGYEGTTDVATSVSVGGNALTNLATADCSTDIAVSAWVLGETDIQSGAQTLTINGSQATIATVWYSVYGADQTLGNHTTGTDVELSAASGSTGSFARLADGYTGACGGYDIASASLTLTNPTQTTTWIAGASNFVYGTETSTSETVTTDWANGGSREVGVVAWNIGPATASGIVIPVPTGPWR
jgi:hypothetical protein